MIQQSLVSVHGRSGHLWRPIEVGIFPLCELWLTEFEVLRLVGNMVLVEAELSVGITSVDLVLDLFIRDTFAEPLLELRVVEAVITSGNRCLRNIIEVLSS